MTVLTHRQQTVKQINILEGNALGNDYITTDPHACLDVFKKAVENLTDGDRLFVCGDLVDRGPESLALLRYIKQHNTDYPQRPIHAIRGNHEDIALESLKAIAKLSDFLADKTELLEKILSRCAGYSYEEKCRNSKYHVDFINQILILIKGKYTDDPDNSLTNLFFNLQNGTSWLFGLSPDERAEEQAFIESLPYMMRIGAVPERHVSAFDIVHAAPLTETAIKKVINSS